MRPILLLLPLIVVLHGCVDSPKASRRDPPRRSAPAQPPKPGPELKQCLGQLQQAQASYALLPNRTFSAGCHNVGTVRLASLRSDSAHLELSNLGPVTCNMATQFAGWARFGADRAAQQIMGSRLARIETYGSYSCRTVAGSRRLSGHSTANAIDVSGFVLEDGRRISVLEDWDGGTAQEKRFLRTVQASACKRFGTTLGPEYNAAHRNHFHFEADGANFCR